MLEKLGAAVVIVGTFTALWGIKTLNLPVFIIVLLAFVCTIVCLVGIVFLFSEGPILTSSRRVKMVPHTGKTMKETAS